MKKRTLFFALGGLVIVAAIAWGPIVSNVEQAKYDVVEKHGNIEIRDYAPMMVAKVSVLGERDKAISKGFRMIADFIFGNNTSLQNVAMTAPVTQQASQKIAMTAPVIQQGDKESWVVKFVMPANYTMQTLPKPNNPAVTIEEIPQKRFATIRFSGFASKENLEQQNNQLNAFIQSKNLHVKSKPIYAFFNPPWTLPFMRRNEVMIEVEK